MLLNKRFVGSVLAFCFVVMIAGIAVVSTAKAGDLKTGGTQFGIITSVPRTMTYQGILKEDAGQPIVNDTLDITFRIYDALIGGSELWNGTESAITNEGGYFSATLSNLNLPFDEDYYLQIEVEQQVLSPRQKLNMSAYSARTDTSDYAINADMLDGMHSTEFAPIVHDHDDDYVNEGQPNSITSNMIFDNAVTNEKIANDAVTSMKISDGTILFGDIGQNGAGINQVMKWNGTVWIASDDSVGGGASNWSVTDSVLYTNGYWGLARGGAGNILYGDSAHTHVNFGVACTTGTSGLHLYYAAVSGGYRNRADSSYATVGGGYRNTASGNSAVIGGGYLNTASYLYTTVGGGFMNTASGDISTVGGGYNNAASNGYATVSGGYNNAASNGYATVGGGRYNTASGILSTIGGGYNNIASVWYTAVGGGYDNTAGDTAATVCGGKYNYARGIYSVVAGGGGATAADSNSASGSYSAIGGGRMNTASGIRSTVGGGYNNTASLNSATVGGGYNNMASDLFATVGGGAANAASGNRSTVGGGESNTASGDNAMVGGGTYNAASGSYSAVLGGIQDTASGYASTVGGGRYNYARGIYSVVAGGGSYSEADSNAALSDWSVVSGGRANIASDTAAVVGGGYNNGAQGIYSVVSGGINNTASGSYAVVAAGYSNTASGLNSTVLGGRNNLAAGNFSLAAGRDATANHGGSFVWADDSRLGFASSANDQFNVRASGGTRIFSNSSLTAGVILNAGSSSWSSVSDSTLKRNIRPVDGVEILEKLSRLPVSRWSYKAQDESIEHIGPMAQDFYSLFSLGEDDKHISTIDPDGVALAAIQSLYTIVQEQEAEIDALKEQLSEVRNNLNILMADREAESESKNGLSYAGENH